MSDYEVGHLRAVTDALAAVTAVTDDAHAAHLTDAEATWVRLTEHGPAGYDRPAETEE